MSRGYETFEHTADIGIRAWGKEFSELFEEAAKALFSVIVDLDTVSVKRSLKVELNLPLTPTLSPEGRGLGEGVEELFLAWLKELLFIFETQHLLLSQFKVLELRTTHKTHSPPSPSPLPPVGGEDKSEGGSLLLGSPMKLVAEVRGEPLNNSKHALGREVKAITHHQFKLTREKSRYLTEVILDI